MAPALAAASGDSSPGRDHSPGSLPSQAALATPAALTRVRCRRLVASLTASRLHSASHLRNAHPARTGIRDRPGFASRLIRFAQTPLGLRCSLSLRRLRDFLPAEPHPAGRPIQRFGSGRGPRSAARYMRLRWGARQHIKVMNSSVIVSSAPSIFEEHARPGIFSRYTFVSTAQVVALLGPEGWEPVKALEQRMRLRIEPGLRCTKSVCWSRGL